MIESSYRMSFAFEPVSTFLGGQLSREEFESNVPVKNK